MNLTAKVLIAMLLGITVGLVINVLNVEVFDNSLLAEGAVLNEYVINGFFHIVGKMFVNALKMLVVPLVLFSLICGVCGIGDIKLLGRIGSKCFVLYLFTTAVAIASAIGVAATIGIGEGMNATSDAQFTGKDAPPLSEVLIDIIPSNPIQAMARGEMLSIIFFAVLAGISILMVGKKARTLVETIELMNEVMMKMVGLIMSFAPYAVFCLLAKAMANLGFDLFLNLVGYVFVLIGVLLLHMLVTLQAVLAFGGRLNPLVFLAKMRNVQVFAFSTSSSNATLPLTIETTEKEIGVSREISSFVLPLGATINMDGTALYQAVATMFIAQVLVGDLTLATQFGIVLTATLASIGAAGVPSAGIIILIVVLQGALPPSVDAAAGIALILGVDRILDMCRTALNVTGDMTAAAVIARSEGERIEPPGAMPPAA